MNFSPWTVRLANLDPIVGSEQGRSRPVLIISESSLNSILPVVPHLERSYKQRTLIHLQQRSMSVLDVRRPSLACRPLFRTGDDSSGCRDGLPDGLAVASSGGDAFCAAAGFGSYPACPRVDSGPERPRLLLHLDERRYSTQEQIGPSRR